MRMFRVLVVGVLVASGLAMLTPGASASVPALSKTCKALQSLDNSLNKVLDSRNYDSGSISNLAKSFRTGAKTAPKRLRSAMNEIAAVASDAASGGSTAAAARGTQEGCAKAWGSGGDVGNIPLDQIRGGEFHDVLSPVSTKPFITPMVTVR